MEVIENPFTEALLDALEGYQVLDTPKDEDFIYGPFPSYDDDEFPF